MFIFHLGAGEPALVIKEALIEVVVEVLGLEGEPALVIKEALIKVVVEVLGLEGVT